MLSHRIAAATRVSLISIACAIALATSAAAQSQSVTLAWDASTQGSVTGYEIRYGTQPGVYTNRVNVGNRTTWTLSGLGDNYRYYFVVLAYDATGQMSVPSNEINNGGLIVDTTVPAQDNRPSFFWQNQTTDELMTWHLNGSAVVQTGTLSMNRVPEPNWDMVGTGDLNGDSYPDVVWRNRVDGRLAVWFLRDETVISTQYLSLSPVSDLGWRVRAVADVNGDGRADLVWRHSVSGDLVVWFMNGSTVSSFSYLSNPRVADQNWQLVGAGDLNGDRRADLVWHNRTTGQLIGWLLDGPQVLGWAFLSLNASYDTNWQVQSVGDIDRDGRADLVWRHQVTGEIVIWYMAGYQVRSFGFLTIPSVTDLNWRVGGVTSLR